MNETAKVEEIDISCYEINDCWFLVNRELRISLPFPDVRIYVFPKDEWKKLFKDGRFLEGYRKTHHYTNEHLPESCDADCAWSLVDGLALINKRLEKLNGKEKAKMLREQNPLFKPDYVIVLRREPISGDERIFLEAGFSREDYRVFRIIHEMMHICEHEEKRQFVYAENHDKEFEIFRIYKQREKSREENKSFLEFITIPKWSTEQELSLPKEKTLCSVEV